MSDPIEEALGHLREAIAARLRAEQLRDQLTGLANDVALTEWLTDRIEDGGPFWAAFVEVDKFKDINDQFGYDDADELLRRIGHRLQIASQDYFPNGAVAFRAHGDEFFLVGEWKELADPRSALDEVRREIGQIRISHKNGRTLRATVSVGWLLSSESLETEEGLTSRSVRGHLELAVAEAKVDRDCVVAFSSKMRSTARRSGRADCSSCKTKLSLTLPDDDEREGTLSCPNCGEPMNRPPSLKPPQPTIQP